MTPCEDNARIALRFAFGHRPDRDREILSPEIGLENPAKVLLADIRTGERLVVDELLLWHPIPLEGGVTRTPVAQECPYKPGEPVFVAGSAQVRTAKEDERLA